ncbi:Phytochelatin synthase-domain-containing protein [Spinellus fusiger]|nr:Phytochelatin synthase-domain-containing protein [Spinellus fusiger]
MVLNAMGVDPKRRWKGVWRWYSDELLECCSNKEDMKKNGITFNEFACLAKCHCNVIAKRIYNVSFEEFKKDVETITTRSNQFMVVSFSRKGLGQTGDGHFSPIAAYNQKDQKVLILDTARFKYPSFWCPIETLYESMKPIDKETGRSRGYFLLSYDSEHPPINLCKVSKNTTSQEEKETTNSLLPDKLNWSTIAQGFCKKIPENMALENPATLEQVVKIVLRNVPTEYTTVLLKQSIANTHSSDAAIVYINQLMQDITHFSLYPIVLQALYPNRQYSHSASPDTQAAFSTLFIMGSPFTFYTSLPRELQVALKQHRDRDSVNDRARHEIDRVSLHVNELTTSFCVCSSDGMKEGVKINKVC